MKLVDLAHLLEHLHVAHVVRQRMVTVGDADFGIGARRSFAADHERRDARDIGLERDEHHVGHQAEVVRELRRHAEGLLHAGIDHDAALRGLLHLLLRFRAPR